MTARVSLQEVARRAGCSAMAVSLALRNSPRVSAARRAHIQDLARRMGYAPNPLISAWVAERGRNRPVAVTLAVVTKFGDRTGLASARGFSGELWRGLRERAGELGFRLEEFAAGVPGAPGGARLTAVLRARGIHGVVLFPGGDFARDFPALDWRHFCVVAAAFHGPSLAVHRTASDSVQAMQLCLEQATLRGYRRPGLAVTPDVDRRIRHAFSGPFLAWQQSRPASHRVPLLGEPPPGTSPAAAFRRWIERFRPDLVIAADEPVEDWRRALPPALGRDLGFMALTVRGSRRVAGVDPCTAQVGRSTIDLLARHLFLNAVGLPEAPEVVLTACKWREGPTIRAISPSGMPRRPGLRPVSRDSP